MSIDELAVGISVYCLGAPKLCHILLDQTFHTLLQVWSVPKHEKNLQPDEERCQEEGLEYVVEQRRLPALEFAMTNELSNPRTDMRGQSPVVGGHAVGAREVVGPGSAGQQEDTEGGTSDWFEENVQHDIGENGEEGEVWREVRYLELLRNVKQRRCIGALVWSVGDSGQRRGSNQEKEGPQYNWDACYVYPDIDLRDPSTSRLECRADRRTGLWWYAPY